MLDPCGGITVVELDDENGNRYIGMAVCSFSDQYVRRVGYRIALQRAKYAMEKNDELYAPEAHWVPDEDLEFVWDCITPEEDEMILEDIVTL